MTRRRWIADEVSEDRAALTGANAAHLVRVLRARMGQQFDIACGNQLRLGTIASISDDRVEFELGETLDAPSPLNITLLLAVFKFDRLEWAIEKCTELGVLRIVPVIASRTEQHLAAAASKRVERWRRIAHEASQQSRRLLPPTIDDPMKLKQALAIEAATKLLLDETEQSVTVRDALEDNSDPVALAIGPEGGWTGDEVKLFRSGGWQSVTLGSTILRAETAAIASVAVVAALLE
ncbi:MAG TPA: RsmE family RNA methyltransferase [candidate division Zixibacteria bacterium]|nr:RsmE family RNA methyltransferase [candidate division Zixibacteria bacterium]